MAPSGFSLVECSQSTGFFIFICPVHQKGVALPGTNAPYQLPAFRGIAAVPGRQMECKCIPPQGAAKMEFCWQCPPFAAIFYDVEQSTKELVIRYGSWFPCDKYKMFDFCKLFFVSSIGLFYNTAFLL